MSKISSIMLYGGLLGFLAVRLFWYDYKGVMFSFAGVALIGFIMQKLIKRAKS